MEFLDRIKTLPKDLYALDFSTRKKKFLKACFPNKKIHFISSIKDIKKISGLILWGSAPCPDELASDFLIIRIEDGFLRSVGLGVELTKPLSWVVDTRGIYFDATQPSDLEYILQFNQFTKVQLDRAVWIREVIVQSGITKYNVGNGDWIRPTHAKKIILVPGQVESDASIAHGAGEIRTNMGLLQAVRKANPEAYVVYKPHPDVQAGLRILGTDQHNALEWCDERITDISMEKMLNQVDEVHTMTSLTGFEALLRTKKVVCYGKPFYAGWGLTTDICSIHRRTRKLTLDELVVGALIIYPTYLDADGRSLVEPEKVLSLLSDWKQKKQGAHQWWRGMYRFILRLIMGSK